MISGGGCDNAGPTFLQPFQHVDSPASGTILKVLEGLLDSWLLRKIEALGAGPRHYLSARLICTFRLHGSILLRDG
jgi:hypothetical protein